MVDMEGAELIWISHSMDDGNHNHILIEFFHHRSYLIRSYYFLKSWKWVSLHFSAFTSHESFLKICDNYLKENMDARDNCLEGRCIGRRYRYSSPLLPSFEQWRGPVNQNLTGLKVFSCWLTTMNMIIKIFAAFIFFKRWHFKFQRIHFRYLYQINNTIF